ncbi:phage tail tape measure protein [Peribacillus frigoritolerans]|uniref:phage tail tape measure protein n=1 Tax=Peribacillus frigoritolerans TaxID=450367 RepID=UPI002E1E1D06|nr:phage tail tape measure protein [Peribacillus frigoritolerans]MED4693780.1 phage tail tape measure protein [Peribacillus frigoritolerans]
MVEEQIGEGLFVGVGLDDTKFTKGTKNVMGQMQLLNSELKAQKSQFGKYGDSIDALKSTHENLGKQFNLQKKYVSDLKKRYEDLVKSHGATSNEAIEAGKRLNKAGLYYNELIRRMDKTGEKIDNLENKWKTAGKGITTFANKVSGAGDRLRGFGDSLAIGVSAPIAGIGVMAVKTGMKFDKEMSKIQAVSGATADEFKELRKQAIALGASTTKSASEVATGQLELAKSGFTTQEILKAMPGVISASEASGSDMAQTAEVMASSLNIFGKEASEAGNVADVLAKVANVTAADLTDMQYALKYAGSPAASLGVSFEELSGSIGLMTNAGMKGEQAGTTLRSALLSLLDPSEENSKLMDKMGVTITDNEGNFVGIANLIDNLSESMEGQTETQKAANLASLVGKEAVSGMLSLMATGGDDIDKMTESLENSAGESAKAAKIMNDNFGGAMEALMGTMESIGIQVSDVMTPTIRELAEWLGKMGDKFSGLDEGTKKTIVTLALFAAGIAPVTIGMAILFKSFGTLAGGIGAGIQWFGKYRTSAKLTTASITTMGTQATIAGAKVERAGGRIGRAGKGMGAVKGGAMAAGTGLSMMGGKFGMVAGIATMFLPELINIGGRMIKFGTNAVKTGGGLAGMGGKVFTAVKSVKNLGSVLAIARGGLAAFGGPVGLAVTGVMLLAQGCYKLYKHLKEESIPAVTDFGDKVSESTTKAVLGYKDLNEKATSELNLMASEGQIVSQKMADNLVGTFGKMGDTIKNSLKKDFDDSKKNMESLFTGSVLTDEYQNELLGKIDSANAEKVAKIEKFEARVKEITDKAVREKRETSEVEKVEINAINKQMMDMAVKTLSEGQVEQQAIMEKLRVNSSSITARTAAKTVADSKKAKDGTIKEANKKYDGAIAAIIRERDETGSISKEEADTLIGEAKRQRDQSVKKAKEMHKGVVAESQKQAKVHIDDVDWETGKVLTGWDKMQNGIKKAVDYVRGLFGKGKTDSAPSLTSNKSVSKKPIPMMATGTPNGTHAGGPAIISEKGRELINEPGVGTYLSGNNGAELVNLRRGTSVLPNHHTEKLLKSYKFPAYAKGTDDDFDWVTNGILKGGKFILGKAFDKFGVKNDLLPELSTISSKALIGNPVSSFLSTGAKWAKDLIDSFGGSGGGGKAPNIKGGASAWRGQIQKAAAVMRESLSGYELNGIIAQIQRESGGNQKITQSSLVRDINTASGNPARGLLQYIPQTFNAYKMKGANNIYSGYDQLLAFFNNKTWRRDLPFGKRGWSPRGGRKYGTGGEINHRQMAELGERGWKEWVLTSEPKYRENNLKMWQDAGESMGVSKSATSAILSGQDEGKVEALLQQVNENIHSLTDAIAKSDKVIQMIINDRVMGEAIYPTIEKKLGKTIRNTK